MIPDVDTAKCRTSEMMTDATHILLTMVPAPTGPFPIDDSLLAEHGLTDFDRYAVVPGRTDLLPDFFVN